ncbi:MAG: diguanylate cyclase [Candidatus Cloacimonetes bacterium]|nr:diguanylate cyclase [Candidatus Cloacimonadota bacterium]
MKRKKILVVEDSKVIGNDLKITLTKFGYEVPKVAVSGNEAFKMIGITNPDLVLMDIKLKGELNGIDTTRIIQKKFSLPVIYLTAYSDEKTIMDAKTTEPFGYLIKPFNDKELFSTIEMALYRYQLENELKKSKLKIEELHETALQLASKDTIEDIFTITIKAAEEILKFPLCYLNIFNEKDNAIKKCSSLIPARKRNKHFFSNDFYKKIIESKKTYIYEELKDKQEINPKWEKIRSGIISPFCDYYLFQVASAELDAFNKDDVKLLELLLGHTSEALKRINLQDELKEQAIIDPLTKVYNRFYLYQALKQEVKHSTRYKRHIAFIVIDVNGLKKINDNYGHHMGDKALQNVAFLLVEKARDSDIVVRSGGDEFIIMLPETGKEVDILKKRIKESMDSCNNIKNKLPFPVNFAIGSAFWNCKNASSIDEIIALADKRMYENKQNN